MTTAANPIPCMPPRPPPTEAIDHDSTRALAVICIYIYMYISVLHWRCLFALEVIYNYDSTRALAVGASCEAADILLFTGEMRR